MVQKKRNYLLPAYSLLSNSSYFQILHFKVYVFVNHGKGIKPEYYCSLCLIVSCVHNPLPESLKTKAFVLVRTHSQNDSMSLLPASELIV